MRPSRQLVCLASLLLVSVLPIQHAEGQCRVNEGAKLTAFGAGQSASSGWSVSISGDVAMVGAWQGTSGSAYVYRFDGSTWVEEQKLIASNALGSDYFGWSVSVSGNVAVVGALGDDNQTGAAYVYRFDGSAWVEEQKLTASDGAAFDNFGSSVSISGGAALVGSQADNDSGSSYVYRIDDGTWIEEQKLIAADAPAGAFGVSVSLDGDVAIVGAPFDNDAGINAGSSYVYRFDGRTWIEEQKLIASDDAFFEFFGFSVSISGDSAVVGAWVPS